MFKKTLITLVLLSIFMSIIAQEIRNDIIEVNYSQKSVKKALILSSLFPGAGQFYADKKSITTYISPIIELGLIVGYFHFTSQGDDVSEKYEKFADQNYDRVNQAEVQWEFLLATQNPSYNNHFRLDGISENEDGTFSTSDNNTQHFYEDIGKYNKYIFGWNDWYDIYVGESIAWEWGSNSTGTASNWTWLGNNTINTSNSYYANDPSAYDNVSGKYSSLRNDYIIMRQEAEGHYDNARLMTFGLAFNHIISAIDAVRLTKRHNLEYLSQSSPIELHFAPVFVNNEISPALMISKRF